HHTPPASPLVSLSFLALTPQILHAFPTRRSSDLRNVHQIAFGLAPRRGLCRQVFRREVVRLRVEPVVHAEARSRRDEATHDDVRSEEHTSELQSRENLVCRLLLGKKKLHSGLAHA